VLSTIRAIGSRGTPLNVGQMKKTCIASFALGTLVSGFGLFIIHVILPTMSGRGHRPLMLGLYLSVDRVLPLWYGKSPDHFWSSYAVLAVCLGWLENVLLSLISLCSVRLLLRGIIQGTAWRNHS